MFGKPKFGDTDEEILKQQREYYQRKTQNKIELSTKYAGTSKNPQDRNTDDDHVPSDETFHKTHPDQNVLPQKLIIGKIIERKNNYETVIDDNVVFKTGFPQATRRNPSTHPRKDQSRSIFAQQSKRFQTTPKDPQQMEIDPKPSVINEFVSTEKLQARLKNLPSKSFILNCNEKDEIHQENINRLEKMTEDEIIKERNDLINALDPEIVKFFKSKRHDIDVIHEDKPETMDFNEDITEPEEIETANEIINKSDKWLNFGTVETEKLQWMKNIVIPNKTDNETYEARFDFNGWLLPFTEPDITEENRVLYHHGKDAGRPGYSLQELFKLCRSNVQQQRVLSLNTISNILAINSTGVYENVLEIPIEQIFFVIRIAMDDNAPSVLNAALKAMHHIFYSQIDEVCLDSLLTFGCSDVQPILTVEKQNRNSEDVEDEKEINDQKMSELDLVKCLMRTDILIRIRYIINTVRPNVETITYCIELLIRILRDSNEAFNQVIECEDLIASIIRNFLPKIYQLKIVPSGYDSPQVSVIKLVRIIATRNNVIANILAEKYRVLESISSYISNDIGSNVVGVRIQTESLNLLGVYLNYGLKIEHYMEIVPFLLRNLEYHLNNTNMNDKTYANQSHFSAIVNVIKRAADVNVKLVEIFTPILRNCCSKYFQQVSVLNDFRCGSLQIISSLLSLLSKRAESYPNEITSLLKSSGFNKITTNIKSGSNLLCGYDSLKSSPNLMFTEAVVWNTSEHVVPILLTTSTVPFLHALSSTIVKSSNEVKLTFIQHPNVIKYLKSLKITSKFSLTTNWFTKIETEFLMNIFKSVIDVFHLLSDTMFFYELVVKCIGLFGTELKSDVDYILKNIVFNRKFYPNEILLKELYVTDVIGSLNYLDEIYDCYSSFMGLKTRSNGDVKNLCLDIRIGNIVPIDWMYSPIIVMYSQTDEEKSKTDDSERCRILTRCLQWIFLYETHFPILSSLINTTDRFCRLCCVFLASNSLFLEEDIQTLLKNILDLLLMPDNYKELNFDGDIQGLNNFQDFYTELLEHYQGVSYGNKLFANFVLIPLAQRHNIKWRKVLWSEYEGVTQIINLTEEECVLGINEFIDPMETDLSVLDCYRRSLTSGHLNRSPLLKKIAVFHVENHFKNKRLKQ